jgi:hypothetical protein
MPRIASDPESLTEFSSSRSFQVWRYVVSHRQLLLRSSRTPEVTTRLELLFKNVSAIKLPTHLDALRVRELHDGPSEAVAELGSVERGQRFFFGNR